MNDNEERTTPVFDAETVVDQSVADWPDKRVERVWKRHYGICHPPEFKLPVAEMRATLLSFWH